jgi:hypothetical protein
MRAQGTAQTHGHHFRWTWAAIAVVYILFLLWHEPWLKSPLSAAELDIALKGMDSNQQVSKEEKVAIRAFFSNDDGKPFYNLNLMLYADRAVYADGLARPGIVTGADANEAYGRLVLPHLLRRGSYPLFTSSKIGAFLNEGAQGADFFQEVAIVRYRSRRDMLDMILDPEFKAGSPHKFAALAKNVAVPTRGGLVLDLSILFPLALLLLGLFATCKRPAAPN